MYKYKVVDEIFCFKGEDQLGWGWSYVLYVSICLSV